jgi:hypothetical protein
MFFLSQWYESRRPMLSSCLRDVAFDGLNGVESWL